MPRTYGAWSWRVRGRSGGTRLGPLVCSDTHATTISLETSNVNPVLAFAGIDVEQMGFNSQKQAFMPIHWSRCLIAHEPMYTRTDVYPYHSAYQRTNSVRAV